MPDKIKRKEIIAVDFDGTLCEHRYPAIGEERGHIVFFCKEMKRKGYKLILHTCRGGVKLQEAIEWCKEREIEFDAINDDLEEIKNSEFGKTKSKGKVYANLYLDDRAMTPEKLQELLFERDKNNG